MAADYKGHYDSVLSNFASGYSNGKFLADFAAPVHETEKLSDGFQKFRRQDTARIYDDLISSTGAATEVAYAVEDDSYRCKMRALKGFTNSATQSNADSPHDPGERAAMIAMHSMLLGRERRVAVLANTDANYAADNRLIAGALWTNTTTGEPLANIHTAIETIAPSAYEETELAAFCTVEVANALRRHPDFRGGGALRGVEQMESIAEQCGLDRIYVSNAQYNTANEGQSASLARVWDPTKFAILRVPKGDATIVEGLPFVTFRATRAITGTPISTRRWHDPDRGIGGSEVVVVEAADDEKPVQDDMGALISTVWAAS